jgi:serine/threonine-protein kinase
MSTVYEAIDTRIGRRVALKVVSVPPYLSRGQREETLARLNREARAIGNLSHPNIVSIYHAGEEGDQHYLVMEFLDGITLRQRLDDIGALPVPQAADILDQVASGLDAVHAQNVVHRDIKPGNVMLLGDGRVKLMDFGVARQTDDTMVTRAGMTVGSPAYMAPEQVRGEPATAASDLWALGVLLYEMLAGRPPFAGENIPAVLYQVAHEAPAPLPDASPELDALFRRALDKEPAARFTAARDMAAAFRAAIAPAVPDTVPTLPGESVSVVTPPARAPGASPAAGSKPDGAPRRRPDAAVEAAGAKGGIAAGLAATPERPAPVACPRQRADSARRRPGIALLASLLALLAAASWLIASRSRTGTVAATAPGGATPSAAGSGEASAVRTAVAEPERRPSPPGPSRTASSARSGADAAAAAAPAAGPARRPTSRPGDKTPPRRQNARRSAEPVAVAAAPPSGRAAARPLGGTNVVAGRARRTARGAGSEDTPRPSDSPVVVEEKTEAVAAAHRPRRRRPEPVTEERTTPSPALPSRPPARTAEVRRSTGGERSDSREADDEGAAVVTAAVRPRLRGVWRGRHTGNPATLVVTRQSATRSRAH